MKIKKPALIGLILLGLYIFSTFAFAILQSVRSGVQLPKTNIIDYQINTQLRAAFIESGATILTFEYNLNCENCYEQKGFLENIANSFKQQLASDFYNLYLEEILNETTEQSLLTVQSNLGNKTLISPNQNETFNAICDLMTIPPAICAAR